MKSDWGACLPKNHWDEHTHVVAAQCQRGAVEETCVSAKQSLLDQGLKTLRFATVRRSTKTFSFYNLQFEDAMALLLAALLPASEYYAPVCKDKKQDALYESEFEDIAMTYVSHISPYQITSATHKLDFITFRSGTAGLSTSQSALSIKDLITVNLIYDLVAMCTSIVAVDPNGKVYHARNFDFPTVLRNDTINLLYVEADNNTLYEMTTAAGAPSLILSKSRRWCGRARRLSSRASTTSWRVRTTLWTAPSSPYVGELQLAQMMNMAEGDQEEEGDVDGDVRAGRGARVSRRGADRGPVGGEAAGRRGGGGGF